MGDGASVGNVVGRTVEEGGMAVAEGAVVGAAVKVTVGATNWVTVGGTGVVRAATAMAEKALRLA